LHPGNVAGADEFPEALHQIVTLLERNQIAPENVTLVLDKGSAALKHFVSCCNEWVPHLGAGVPFGPGQRVFVFAARVGYRRARLTGTLKMPQPQYVSKILRC
jgi:hypothetical protein